MKITKIEIKDYQQFKDFTLDLTYPEGHDDAGKPLKKVCFIGQSGTGKTTILEVIKEVLAVFVSNKNNFNRKFYNEDVKKDHYTISFLYNNEKIAYKKALKEHNFSEYNDSGYVENGIDGDKVILNNYYIYLQAGMLYMQNASMLLDVATTKSAIENLYTEDENIKKENAEIRRKISEKKYFDFLQNNLNDIWFAILFDSKDYIIERNRLTNLIGRASIDNNIEAENRYKKEYENLEKSQKYPFQKLTNALNPILQKFNIELTSIFDKISDLRFIRLQTGTIPIPFEKWSTGTKQLVLSIMPLLGLDTKETIILVDEPENSLFPDIQRTLIQTYTKLAEEAQFFFATHSPLIASQFEPWEVVELKFKEDGTVYRELYYEGQNHVDNYTIFPQYLRWDDILTRVFDLDSEGTPEREELLPMALYYKAKIEKLKESAGGMQSPEFENTLQEYRKLANKLGWTV